MSFIYHWLGMDDPSGHLYLWWSGIFGDVTIFAVAIGYAWHRNCSVTGCRSLRSYEVHNTPWRACKKHHPHIDDTDKRITPERIATHATRHQGEA